MAKNRKTSPAVASAAAKLLAKKQTPKTVKEVAGSALSQAAPKAKQSKKK